MLIIISWAIVCLYRKRAVYDVYCHAILTNLIDKAQQFSDLVSDDYYFCNSLGKVVSEGGYPGIVSPSARYTLGKNYNIFQMQHLAKPKLIMHMIYEYHTQTGEFSYRALT